MIYPKFSVKRDKPGVASKRGIEGKIATYTRKLAERVAKALQAVGELVLEESKKLVPIETTALLESAMLRVDGAGFTTIVSVGYARSGFSRVGRTKDRIMKDGRVIRGKEVVRRPAEYAVYVHQIQARHEDGRTWKFLENAIELNRETLVQVCYQVVIKI